MQFFGILWQALVWFCWLIFGFIFVAILGIAAFISYDLFSRYMNSKLLERNVNAGSYEELCYVHSYSISGASTSNSYTAKVGTRTITIPDWSYGNADDGVWVIIGITPNKPNAIYTVDKRTVLQYFNQTDENECKSLKQ